MRVAEGYGKGNIDEKNETTGEKHTELTFCLSCASVLKKKHSAYCGEMKEYKQLGKRRKARSQICTDKVS